MKRKGTQKEKKNSPPPFKTALEERINGPRRMLYASFPKKNKCNPFMLQSV